MTATVVALATTTIILACALVLLGRVHTSEREAWAVERRSLVDRVIARHAGEAIALDRHAEPRQHVSDGPLDRPVPVGL